MEIPKTGEAKGGRIGNGGGLYGAGAKMVEKVVILDIGGWKLIQSGMVTTVRMELTEEIIYRSECN